MAEYTRSSISRMQSSIARPRVEANNFKIKSNIIQMLQNNVQFDGLPDEDLNAHVRNFLKVCDIFKINGISKGTICLHLFPFFLRGKAKSWLKSLSLGSITSRDSLVEKILREVLFSSRTTKLRNEILSFLQIVEESLYKAWERWNEHLRKCPHYGLDLRIQI